MAGKPNLLLLHCHDLGDFLGCYGHPVLTPNLDRLASEGVVFEKHFSTGTVCSPSRGSIMTGCYPHTHGLMGLVHRGWNLDTANHATLPMLLAARGWHTLLAGIQHEHTDPYALGYQTRLENKHCYSETVADQFIRWLNGRDFPASPFMASVGFWEPHRNGLNPSHFRRIGAYPSAEEQNVRVPGWLPDIPEVRKDLADFYGAVAHADQQAGRILDALDARGIRDDTLVVFTTDHGPSFAHAKGTLYDGGTHVALLMRGPGLPAAGTRVPGLTSHVDLLPTLLELVGAPRTAGIEGRSVMPALRGNAAGETREAVFAENNFTNSFDPARMARTGRFKYIRKGVNTSLFDFNIPEIELCPSGFRSNRALFDFYSHERNIEELFDLEKDPSELRNLAASPGYHPALMEMRNLLERHMADTGDPFAGLLNPIRMPGQIHL